MAPTLNKFLFVFLLFAFTNVFSQSNVSSIYTPSDYKEGDRFAHYLKRRKAVSKWQINQLKNGALMVMLKTNQRAIDALKAAGKIDLATEKERETNIINKNTVKAFLAYYTFSKVYFFYSYNADTLLNGARTGIFIDTNLVVDPNIKYNENFYLLAEQDFDYNTSIGFIPQDTAKFIKETGGALTEAFVIKNKYGHILKHPFPYFHMFGQHATKYMSYVGLAVTFNREFYKFYTQNKGYEVTDPKIKPFLY